MDGQCDSTQLFFSQAPLKPQAAFVLSQDNRWLIPHIVFQLTCEKNTEPKTKMLRPKCLPRKTEPLTSTCNAHQFFPFLHFLCLSFSNLVHSSLSFAQPFFLAKFKKGPLNRVPCPALRCYCSELPDHFCYHLCFRAVGSHVNKCLSNHC